MTEPHDLVGRADIDRLLTEFYAAARQDARLGPVFQHAIADDAWPAHLAQIGDFWETVLLQTGRYHGAPIPAHISLDRSVPLDGDHFERWLRLFETAADALFAGPLATEAKKRARLMAPLMLYKIEAARRPGFLR